MFWEINYELDIFRHKENKPVSSGSARIIEVLDKIKSNNFSVMTYFFFSFFLMEKGFHGDQIEFSWLWNLE